MLETTDMGPQKVDPARLGQPLGTIKTRIRSGLHKLRHTLTAEAGKP